MVAYFWGSFVMGGKSSAEYYRQYRETHIEQTRLKQARYRALHQGKSTEYMRQWRAKNPEKCQAQSRKYLEAHREQMKQNSKDYGRRLKEEVLATYGNGRCACIQCGESRNACLSIDHINNDGYEQRKTTGNGGRFYGWLKRNGFPPGFQTLCMNCQFIKRET